MADCIPPALVRIEAGSFLMGSDAGRDDESPVHRVELGAFELGACQVTNDEYDLFVLQTGHRRAPHRDEPRFADPLQPVVAVSWFDAVDYCSWLEGVLGRRFRLPAEAEWEYAARGRFEGRLFPSGDDAASYAAVDRRWIDGPEPRASGVPNGFGLYDMCENVHEWCSDWYGPDSYRLLPWIDPRGPEGGVRRVSRGGSWRHHVKISRCAARSSLPPDLQYSDYGFRVACD